VKSTKGITHFTRLRFSVLRAREGRCGFRGILLISEPTLTCGLGRICAYVDRPHCLNTCQRSPVYQKSLYIQESLYIHRAALSKKSPKHAPKDPYISAKRAPYIRRKNPTYPQKESYCQESLIYLPKEPYISAK